jgi:hypothetical protein
MLCYLHSMCVVVLFVIAIALPRVWWTYLVDKYGWRKAHQLNHDPGKNEFYINIGVSIISLALLILALMCSRWSDFC